ncbi:MAG: chorismate mutase [Deltaproteobacteria bacterium]|nr:chorismate mutase [Deltaproteobacteria bacterium]
MISEPYDTKRITELREDIAKLDRQILKCLAKRLVLAAALGEIKERLGLSLQDCEWETAVLKRNLEAGAEYGLKREVVAALTEFLISQALAHQESLIL